LTKFNVLLSPVARKFLDNLDTKTADRIRAGLKNLEDDSYRKRPMADLKKLEGHNPPLYRIRIGNYRAVYFITENEVKVTEIIPRGKGYEWLD